MKNQQEERTERILLSLKTLDYLSTTQIGRLLGSGGERNTRRIIEGAKEYLSSFRDRENVYYLNKAGRARVGADKERQKITPVDHYLMRNDLYLYRKPQSFETEQRFKIGEIVVVTDALMTVNTTKYLVEVDNLQSMAKNTQKIEKYKRLKDSGAVQKLYGYFPRIVWVCLSDARRKQLTELCVGLETIVHTWDEIR